MIEVRQTPIFGAWLAGLKDLRAAAQIARRLVRLEAGLLGDIKPVGGGVSELRVHHGPGYRLYLTQRGPVLIVLLCGGDKGSQRGDIERAKRMAGQLED
jgi:putative addiction module killer protein